MVKLTKGADAAFYLLKALQLQLDLVRLGWLDFLSFESFRYLFDPRADVRYLSQTWHWRIAYFLDKPVLVERVSLWEI